MKRIKLFITLITIFILISSIVSTSFAANISSSVPNERSALDSGASETTYADLYIDDQEEYEIKNVIEGNVFSSASILNIDPKENGGQISGDLFAIGTTITIKSDVVYSETEKDEFGDAKIQSFNSISSINGNVYITAQKFILEPGSEINGDLYVCADEVVLSQNSKIKGNVYIVSNNLTMSSQIGGSLYATAKVFDMKYYGFISRDMHLSAETAKLNGYIYRDSFIDASTIEMENKFISEKNLNIEDASSVKFAGQVKKNATINCEKIEFNRESTCEILGDLKYSTNNDVSETAEFVSGNVLHSEYESTSSTNFGKSILDFVISFVSLLLLVFAIYFLINKLTPNFAGYLSDLKTAQFFIAILIGLGALLAICLAVILLFIIRIGSLVAFLLLLVCLLLLLIAKSIFIIAISSKLEGKLNKVLSIIIITFALSLIELIPFVGTIISLLIVPCGIGIIAKSIIKK